MPYICDRCSLLCSDLSTLKVHMRKHTNEKPFSCHVCNRRFTQKGNLNTHLANVHSGHKQFICDICSKQFAQRKTLDKHQIKCGKPSSEESLLYMNYPSQKEHTLSNQFQSKLTSYRNTAEGFNIISIPTATDHQMFGDNKVINSASTTLINDSDIKKNNNGQIFVCDKCDKTFKSKTKLLIHIAVHGGVAPRPFVCHVCDKGFTHKGSMNAHIRFIHKGEKPFACPTCPKKFSNKCHLKLHVKTHSHEASHKCETCGKIFSRVEHYKYHLKTHTKEFEIFGCISCDASFNNAAMLRNHIKLHSKNKVSRASIGEGDNKMHNEDSSNTGHHSTFHNILSAAKTLSINPSTVILKQPLYTATRTDEWKGEIDGRLMDQIEPIDKNLLSLPLQSFAGTGTIVTSCVDSLKSFLSQDIINAKRNDSEFLRNSEARSNFVPALNETTSSRYGGIVTWSTLTLERLHGYPATGTPNHEITSKQVSNNTNSFEKCVQFLQPHINSASFLNNSASAALDAQISSISAASTNTFFSFFNAKTVEQCTNFCSIQSHIASDLVSVTNIISSNSSLLPPIVTGKRLPCSDSISSTAKMSSSFALAASDVSSNIHRLYRCTECGKKFSSPHRLLDHQRVHSGERPYKCKDCTSCFTQAGSLKVHVDSVHAGQKKHKCSICSWTFARASHLKRHELRHSDKKPYRCVKCSRTFIERSKLRKHLSSHGLDEVTVNELLVMNPPSTSTNTFEPNPAKNLLTSYALIYSVSGDCNKNEDKQIGINQSILKENNEIFPTCKTYSVEAGSEKPAQLMKQLSSVNKVDDLCSEYEKQCRNDELSSQLTSCDAITSTSSISHIVTRSKAKHSKTGIKGNDFKMKEVAMIQEIRTSVQDSCVLWEEQTKSSTLNRKDNLGEDTAQEMTKFSTENNETLPSIENDERKNGRNKKEENVDDNLSLAEDIAMHQDYPNKKKKFKATCSQNKEARPTCKQCGKSFNSLTSLRSHSVVHSGLRPYVCAICDKSFTQSSRLRVHVAVIHNLSRKHQCPQCPKTFSQRSHLKRHLDIHLGVKPFSCEKCGRRFHENNKLMLHKKVHERREKMDKEKNEECLDIYRLTCKICSKVFLRKSYLNKHVALHRLVNTYQCDVCSKQYRQKSSLEVHMRRHTGEKPFSCEFCDERFARSSSLSTHRVTRHEVQTYKCSTCSQKFSRVSSLASHLAKAHNEVLSERGLLEGNMKPTRTAVEPRPWACSDCSKRFSHKSLLDIHNRVHSREKPFTCPICNKLFTQKGSLCKHLHHIHDG